MMSRIRMFAAAAGISLCVALTAMAAPALAQSSNRVSSQRVYVSVYSHVYAGDRDAAGKPRAIPLSTLVSLRNTDTRVTLRLRSARYFDTDGKELREFAAQPIAIGPMATHEIFIPQSDLSGGSGANLLIDWDAETPASPPLVEAVHLEVRGSRPISFVTGGRVVER